MSAPTAETGSLPVSFGIQAAGAAAARTRRPIILFVGSFAPAAKDGAVGGQLYACRTLIESGISRHVQWRLIDSTQRSVPPPHLLVRAWHAGRRMLQLLRQVRRRDVAAVLVFSAFEPASLMEKALMCMLARAAGRRTVVSLRSEVRRLWWPAMCAARCMVGACDAVICQSQQAADALKHLFPAAARKTTVVSNWIDSSPFAASDERPRGHEACPVLLFMGRLESYKGPDTLLAAAALLRQKGAQFRLVYCGDGSLRSGLMRQAQQLQIDELCQWRGWVHGQEKQQAFREAAIFILPSRQREGVPNVLLEAMAAGLPVVTTAVSGIPSIAADGVNAQLVPVDDPPALADAIQLLLSNPQRRRELAAAGRRAAQARDVELVWPRLAEAILGRPL